MYALGGVVVAAAKQNATRGNQNGDEHAGGDKGKEELKDEEDNYYRNIF